MFIMENCSPGTSGLRKENLFQVYYCNDFFACNLKQESGGENSAKIA